MDLQRVPAIAVCKRILLRFANIFALCVACLSAQAAVLEVQVRDRDGNPVPDVAVYAVPAGGGRPSADVKATAVMDQIDTRFVPHVLVVQSGTAVGFPNTDATAHHVYSFSRPNQFMLPIYKGDLHPPVTFEHAGLVTLGCNIHDNMLGYILVVDTDIFRKTNNVGWVTLPMLETGAVEVHIWSPRLRDPNSTLSQTVELSVAEERLVRFDLQKKLRPPHDSNSGSVSWSEY